MDALITTLINIALIFGLWWLYFVEFKALRLDVARQKLFDIRDELFADAVNGDIALDSKAYQLVRTTLNGMIRFTHKISVIRIMATIYADDKIYNGQRSKEFRDAMNSALSALSHKSRKKVMTVRRDMHRVVTMHIVFSSIILTASFIILLIMHLSKMVGNYLLNGKISKEWSAIDAEAEQLGTQDCEKLAMTG